MARTRDSNSGCATTMPAPQSAITYSSSGLGCDTDSGTAIPPARQMLHCVAT